MNKVLEHIRQKVGPAPRRIPPESRNFLITRPQIWCVVHKDPMLEYFRSQELLLREGQVVWGAVVQANGMCYGVGPSDHPSTVIYSMDRTFDDNPEGLVEIAKKLLNLRGGKWADQEEQSYGDMLAIETNRAMGIPIPKSIAEGRKIFSTTIMWRRRHLPSGVLKGSYFPVLVHPKTTAVLVVPSQTWPEEFAQSWRIEPEDWHQKARTSNIVDATWEYQEFLREGAKKAGLTDPWYLRLYIDEPTDGFDLTHWRVEFPRVWHPSRHILSEVGEFKFIISRSQADLWGGMILHRNDATPNLHPDPSTAIRSVRD